MADSIQATGSCMCGAVEVKANKLVTETGACHCSMCRNWCGGAPMFAVECEEEASFTGEEHITRYSSSDWAERGFCKQCGTNLFYYLKPANQYHFAAGLFPEAESFNFTYQIFIEEKPELYSFANETKNMTGEEVFAQVGAD